MRSTHVAIGPAAAVLAAVLLTLACGGSNTHRPSNLTGDQRARPQDFAEKVEREGNLRPALPAYVPPGLDPYPYIFNDDGQSVTFAFDPTPQGSPERTAVPLGLGILEQFDRPSEPLLCGDESSFEDYHLPWFECARVGGHPADLVTTEQDDGTVQHEMSFEIDDLYIYITFEWKRGPDASLKRKSR